MVVPSELRVEPYSEVLVLLYDLDALPATCPVLVAAAGTFTTTDKIILLPYLPLITCVGLGACTGARPVADNHDLALLEVDVHSPFLAELVNNLDQNLQLLRGLCCNHNIVGVQEGMEYPFYVVRRVVLGVAVHLVALFVACLYAIHLPAEGQAVAGQAEALGELVNENVEEYWGQGAALSDSLSHSNFPREPATYTHLGRHVRIQ